MAMGMDQAILPLNFYCRNARLYLKKANFSKRSQMFHEELSHLRKFENLMGSTIPSHPLFEEKKTDKLMVELQLCLADARKRIQELESEPSSSRSQPLSSSRASPKSEKSTPRSKSSIRSPRLVQSDTGAPLAKPPKKAKTMPKSSDSPTKQHSWGVWTANPNPYLSSNPAESPASALRPRSLSPKKHNSPGAVKGKRNMQMENKSSTDAASPPLRSSSPDQRAEAILGGCALLATLQNVDNCIDEAACQSEDSGSAFVVNGSPPTSRRGNIKEPSKQSVEWLPSLSKGQHNKEREHFAGPEDDLKSSEKATIGGRKFRFASDFFQKRLQERMNRIQSHYQEAEEDGYLSSPVKARGMSLDKREQALQEQMSSGESLSDNGDLSSTLDKVQKHLIPGMGSSAIAERLQNLSMEDSQPTNDNNMVSEADELWASKKFMPALEEKLTGDMLGFRMPPRKVSDGSSREKHRKRGILGVMDDVIRHAVDSDSGISNGASPRPLSHHKDSMVDNSTESFQGLQTDAGKSTRIAQQQSSLQGLQVEALEEKITSLQSLMGDLKGSIEGFTSRVEEEGERWQGTMQGLEKQLQVLRDDTEVELIGIKGSIRDEVQMKLDELTRGLHKAEKLLAETESKKDSTKQKMEARLEDCTTKIDSIKRQVDSLFSDVKTSVVREVKEKISKSVQDMSEGVRSDMEELELGISKDLENLRRELETKLEAIHAESGKAKRTERQQIEALIDEKVAKKLSPRKETNVVGLVQTVADIKTELRVEAERLRKAERQQVEALIDEKIEKRLSQPMEIVSGGKEKVIADMKSELRLLWAEVDLLSKGRVEIKDNVEQLTQIAERAKETISKEQAMLRSENGSLRKQLQYFKNENMQTRMDTQDFKKDIELEMEDLRSTMGRLKNEGEDMRDNIDRLRKVGDDLTSDNKSLRKLVDRMKEEEAVIKEETKALKKVQEDMEMIRGNVDVREGRERILLMEKIENLSQLYLGGLEEIREELSHMKLAYEGRMQELERQWTDLQRQQESNAASEDSLTELVWDGLETRVSHLESNLENKPKVDFEEERFKIESTLAIIEKDREQAALALAQVLSASQKADELVSEMLGTFKSEVANIKRQNLKIQESLASDKDAAAAAASAVIRMRDDVGKEKDLTIAVLSDAKVRSMEAQEGLEKERSGLRNSILMTENERETAALAASEAAAAATRAQEALRDILKAQRQSLSMSDDVAQAVGQVHMKYTNELEDHIKEMRKSILDEVSRARSAAEGIEEERRRFSINILEAPSIQDKMVSHDEFHEQVNKTETVMKELQRTVTEMSTSLSLLLENAKRSQAQSDEQNHIMENEISSLRRKIEEAFSRLDVVANDASKAANEVQLLFDREQQEHEQNEIMQHDLKELDKRAKDSAAEQSSIVEKVRKVENAQMNLVQSVEEVQTSTVNLEKSGAAWLQKYDAAARLLQDMEKRVSALEEELGKDNAADQRTDSKDGELEKEKMSKLYKELSGFIIRLRAQDVGLDYKLADSEESKKDTLPESVNARFMDLESRIEHMDSEASSNLRNLDLKLEEFGVGLHSALEGASMAETKCSALGAELVRVFRILAESRKESPTRTMMADAADEYTEQQQRGQTRSHHHQHQAHHRSDGAKTKGSSSHAACFNCKKGSPKGHSDVEGPKGNLEPRHQVMYHNMYPAGLEDYYFQGHTRSGHHQYEVNGIDDRSPRLDISFKDSPSFGKLPPELYVASKQESLHDLHLRHYHGRDVSPVEKPSRKPGCRGDTRPKDELFERGRELKQAVPKSTSEIKLYEAKLPTTHEKLVDDRQLEHGKKDSTHLGSGKNCQSTDIRLDAGKIQVKLTHRSAVTSGSRVTKRGDAIAVQS